MNSAKDFYDGKKYNLVCFYSEGEPNDKGLNLSENRELVLDHATNHVDNIEFYTPKKLIEMGYDYYVKDYDECGLATENPGMNRIGFEAWKPLIILLELQKMNEGDVLIYRDCNILKYKNLKEYNNIKNITDKCFDLCHFDFVVTRELEHLYLRQVTKPNILRELGENHPFTFAFPNLIANQLFFKKTHISIEFLKDWKWACEHEEWINGTQYDQELNKDFLHSCNAQSLMGTTIANWIRTRKYEIPLKYPQIRFKGRSIYKIRQNKNYGYLKHLD